MSASRNGIAPKVVQDAVDTVNWLLQDRSDYAFIANISSAICLEPICYRVHEIYESETDEGTAALSIKFANGLRKLLPLAEAITKAHARLRDGTLMAFCDLSSFESVQVGIIKVMHLLAASEICVKVTTLTMGHFLKNSVPYASKTSLTKEEIQKMVRVVDFPLELLAHPGMQALSTRLLAPMSRRAMLDMRPEMRDCGSSFSDFVDCFFYPIHFTTNLFRVYDELADLTTIAELHTLPRPPFLMQGPVSKAVVQFCTLLSETARYPVYSRVDLKLHKYAIFLMYLETRPQLGNEFWAIQAQNGEFAAHFLKYLTFWKVMKAYPDHNSRGVEHICPMLCIALMRVFTLGPFEQHKGLFNPLSTTKALNTIYTVGQEMLELSKTSSSSSDDTVNLSVGGTTLMALRVFLIAHVHSTSEAAKVSLLRDPSTVLETLTSLSHGWVQCAHQYTSTNLTPDFNDAMVCVADGALSEVNEEVLVPFLNALETHLLPLPEKTLLAIFKAQEAISTMQATALWIFSTYSHEADFAESKEPLYLIMPEASRGNYLLSTLTNRNVTANNYPKKAALCEAGLKAVEAASKALLWGWNTSPQEILTYTKEHPYSCIPNISEERIEALFHSLQEAVVETFKGTLYCCPYYGYSDTPGDSTSELAKRIGATALKGFHAMGLEPHDGWKQLLGEQFTHVRNLTYFTMPGILQDPNPPIFYERINSVFETAIAPILASPEPWLENAANMNMEESISSLVQLPPVAYHYLELSKQTLEATMKDVVPGGAVEKKRAVARARAIATLQCGYVGCKTIMLPEQKSKVCSACKIVKYCSDKCLKGDWKKNHKIACKAIAAAGGQR